MLESLAPIQKLSVVRAGFTPYLNMVGDRCLAVCPQFHADWWCKNPVAVLFGAPISPYQPFASSGGMLVLRPLHELEVQDMIAPGEDPGRADRSIVVCPSTNDRIEFLDECLLRGTAHFPQSLVHVVDMTLDAFFAWSDDRFETQHSPMRVCSAVGFAHEELPNGEP